MKKVTIVEKIQIERSMEGIREMLFLELENILNGTTTPSKTSQLSKVTSHILSTVKIELDNRRFGNIDDSKLIQSEIL